MIKRLIMKLLGWKRLSRKRRFKLECWKHTAKKCVILASAATVTSAAAVIIHNPVVVVSWTALTGMAAWLTYHVKQHTGEWGV